jgi:hypothetical protein
MGARNRVRRGLSYWPARLHSLAELVTLNPFLGPLKVKSLTFLALNRGEEIYFPNCIKCRFFEVKVFLKKFIVTKLFNYHS